MESLGNDTIVAIATAPGRGGIGVVRISGTNAQVIGERIVGAQLLPRLARFSHFKNPVGAVVDSGIALFFPAPHSFTGEHVVELQGHGNPVILSELLSVASTLGARMAKPGEFSERAFLNNKIDLAQAEAVADLIAAETFAAAKAAQATLEGVFSKKIQEMIDTLIALRVYIESALDFPDEDIELLEKHEVGEKLSRLRKQLEIILQEGKQGALINEGMRVVIAGKPNAGKSSLLNALSGRDSAIVTSIPGTTRDLLHEQIQIDGMPLHLVDTAGLRESENPVELEGMRRALREIEKADRILWVIDSQETQPSSLQDLLPQIPPETLKKIPFSTLFNKSDLSGRRPSKNGDVVTLSAKTGAGMELLKQHLKEVMGFHEGGGGHYSARRRHLVAMEITSEHILTAENILAAKADAVLLAEELRLAQQALEVITGRFTPDDLLDKIFREFCIGK